MNGKRDKGPRNLHAINAHFRKGGPMKDKRRKTLNEQAWEDAKFYIDQKIAKEILDATEYFSSSRPDLTKFLEK